MERQNTLLDSIWEVTVLLRPPAMEATPFDKKPMPLEPDRTLEHALAPITRDIRS